MADLISRLRLDSGEFDSKIKRAGQELMAYSEHCRKTGLVMGFANRDAKDFAKALGNMQTTSSTARGKISELSDAFVNLRVMYKNMTDEEKNNTFGKNLAASLDQLKTRINAAKADLASATAELNDTGKSGGGKFGQLGGIIDTIGQKMGVAGNLTEMLTSKTALMGAGIGAAAAIVGKASEAWARYNTELSRQGNITTVTTGLTGGGANQMTDVARAMADTYGVDFREVINAANTLMTQFGQTGAQSLQLIRDGMQGMILGDGPKLLSMIQQYAPSFRDAGIEASQLVAIIHNSEGGLFTDQNMNAIVMGIKNLRLMTKQTSEALSKLGIDGADMTNKLNTGAMTIIEAMRQVSDAIEGAGSSSQAAGEVMQYVFGRQGTAAGTKLGEAIAKLNTNLEETKRQTGELGDAYAELQTANEKLNTAIRDCFEYDGWDQMATGIKANLISALASVVDWLGRIKGALGGFSSNQQSGDPKNGGGAFVDKAVDNLKQWKTSKAGATTMYEAQLQSYDRQVAAVSFQINNLQEKAAKDMEGNMSVVYEKEIRTLEARREAIRRNKEEYDRKAKAVIADIGKTGGVNAPLDTTSPSPKGGKKPTVTTTTPKAPEIFPENSLKSLTAEMQELQKAQQLVTSADEWRTYEYAIEGVRNQIKELKGELSDIDAGNMTSLGKIEGVSLADIAAGRVKGKGMKDLGLGDVPTRESIIAKGQKQIQGFDGIEPQAKEDKTLENMQKLTSGLSSVTSGLQQMGIELPDGVQKVLGGMQGLMSVIQGVQTIISLFSTTTATAQIAATTGNTAMLTANATALGALATAISFNSATNMIPFLANGGIVPKAANGIVVPGNSFSGDRLRMPILDGGGMIGVNSGEVILNRAQQGNLAAQLEGGGMAGGGVMQPYVDGEKIFLGMNNTSKRMGRGEIVTTSTLRRLGLI